MGRKAVDVVLLPSEAMMERDIEASRQLVDRFGSEIVLSRDDCLPHISLAMGCIDDGDIANIRRVLQKVAKECPPGELEVVGIETAVDSAGKMVSVFEVRRHEQIQLIHERVMREVSPYFSYDVSRDMIYGKGEVSETSLLWIRNYRGKSSFENFSPHITIGYGRAEDVPFPIIFDVERLALCHLGNHCTCGKILVSVEI